MRISDWSSDVCSSDLARLPLHALKRPAARLARRAFYRIGLCRTALSPGAASKALRSIKSTAFVLSSHEVTHRRTNRRRCFDMGLRLACLEPVEGLSPCSA